MKCFIQPNSNPKRQPVNLNLTLKALFWTGLTYLLEINSILFVYLDV